MDDSSRYKKVKTEEDASKTITADGGLALTLIKTEDSLLLPEEDNRSTQGFELTENAKNIKTEPIDPPSPDESFVLAKPASYEEPPIRDQMSTEARISFIIDAVNHIADNTDPECQTFLPAEHDEGHPRPQDLPEIFFFVITLIRSQAHQGELHCRCRHG